MRLVAPLIVSKLDSLTSFWQACHFSVPLNVGTPLPLPGELDKTVLKSIHFRVRKSLANGLFHPAFLLWAQQPAIDAAAHRVKQFQPIFKFGVFHRFPLVVAAPAGVEQPFAAYMLRIHMETNTFVGDTLPTDLGFGRHGAGGILKIWP